MKSRRNEVFLAVLLRSLTNDHFPVTTQGSSPLSVSFFRVPRANLQKSSSTMKVTLAVECDITSKTNQEVLTL